MPPVRLAVVGLGMAARPHFAALAELSGTVEIAGLYARTRDKAEVAATEHGCKAFYSAEEIAQDSSIDAVLLLTPPNQRRELVQLFAAAGKHILCEKPLERNLDAARELVEICAGAGVTLAMVFQNRFKAGALHLRQIMQDNALGDIALVRATLPWWREQAYYDTPGRGTYERDGGGVLITQAIHLLDMMLSVTGPVSAVQALCATTRLHDLEAEDFCSAALIFEDGGYGSLFASTATYPSQPETLVIDGTRGTATLQGEQLTVHWRDGVEERIGAATPMADGSDPMDFSCEWHRELIRDFAHSVQKRTKPMITGAEALDVHALITALMDSSKTGEKVKVPSTGYVGRGTS